MPDDESSFPTFRDGHEGVRRWVETLNRLVKAEPALHELDFEPAGFEWVDASDSAASVLSFLRRQIGFEPQALLFVVYPVLKRVHQPFPLKPVVLTA